MENKDAILELDWILNNGFKADSNLPGTDNCKEALKKGINALYKVDALKIFINNFYEHSDCNAAMIMLIIALQKYLDDEVKIEE